ncbi:hypothetical protein, partial [Bowmanella denitrificans]|uniref:hypothetical protein n=1 Tax=Bowmanella denitrificans TaxID=366582 RepID=UPI001C0F2946
RSLNLLAFLADWEAFLPAPSKWCAFYRPAKTDQGIFAKNISFARLLNKTIDNTPFGRAYDRISSLVGVM